IPDALETVTRNIHQITTLVNDILFMQEMDLILPKFQPVNMVEIVKEVAKKYEDKAAASMVTIDIHAEPDLPNVSGDHKSLERALMALIDNAVKFSPNGGHITIKIREENNDVVVDI